MPKDYDLCRHVIIVAYAAGAPVNRLIVVCDTPKVLAMSVKA